MEEINLLIWNSSQSQRIIWLEEGLCFQRDARSYYYDQFSSHLHRPAELMSPNLSAAEFPCRRLFLLALLPLSFLLSFLDPQPRTTVHYLIIFTSVSCVKKKKSSAAKPICLKLQLFRVTYILSPGMTMQRNATGGIISLATALLFTHNVS